METLVVGDYDKIGYWKKIILAATYYVLLKIQKT